MSKVYKWCSAEEKADTVRCHQHTEASAHSGCVGGLIISFFKVLVLFGAPPCRTADFSKQFLPGLEQQRMRYLLRNPTIPSFHLNCYSFTR